MATTQSLIDYYVDLLIIQYRGKPKARATIDALVKMVIADQIYTTVQNAFSIENAIGVQLDTIGKYAGAKRTGFDFTGPITLTDDEYRTLIKIAVSQNNAGSSLSDIQNFLQIFFAGAIFVFDHLGMRMSYLIDSDVGPLRLIQLFVRQGRLPKPMGVQLTVIYAPVIDDFFGFNTNAGLTVNISGFSDNSGFTGLWLQNSDIISF